MEDSKVPASTLTAVKFRKHWRNYNAGEIAGFEGAALDTLLDNGFADLVDPKAGRPKKPAEPPEEIKPKASGDAKPKGK